jgi:hypothetical protein
MTDVTPKPGSARHYRAAGARATMCGCPSPAHFPVCARWTVVVAGLTKRPPTATMSL